MGDPDCIAVDWGSTNRRVYLLGRDGGILDGLRDDVGIKAMHGRSFADEARDLRGRFGEWPMICAGMVGSDRGWAPVPYLDCPAGLADLATALHWVEPGRTAIVPGLKALASGKGDVMRGEEVQILGAVRAGLVPADARICQPGTHCKWAQVTGGRLATFRTTMTGELFALLRDHSLLADIAAGEPAIGPAFDDGLADARESRLLGDLFRVRASGLLGLRSHADAASYLSGLLIGSDVREQNLNGREEMFVLADPAFGEFYRRALEVHGIMSQIVDSRSAFVAGIAHIRELARDA
jgi:2-dehydro-3-deoxygalactonokinase